MDKTRLIIFMVVFALISLGMKNSQAGIFPPDPDRDCIFQKLDTDITPQAEFAFRVADGDPYQICQLVIFDVNGYRAIKPDQSDSVYDVIWIGDRMVFAVNACPQCTAAMTVYAYEGYRVSDSMFMPVVFK